MSFQPRRKSLFLSLIISLIASVALAAPIQLTHQGQLTDATGIAVDGTHSMTFSLYAAAAGGSALWSETLDVEITNGLYQVILGTGGALSSTLFSGSPAAQYLGISVGSDGELAPRTQLTSSPYAAHSAGTEGFTPGPGNTNEGTFSFVGGDNNINLGDYSSILGGEDNIIDIQNVADTIVDTAGLFDSPSAPLGRQAFDPASLPGMGVIAGGHLNTVNGNHAFIGNGHFQIATAAYTFLGSGYSNQATASYAGVVTGLYNLADGTAATIGGGFKNHATGRYSHIGGGVYNETMPQYIAQAIGGGYLNNANNHVSTIAGGYLNIADGFGATVGGGQQDTARSNYATVSGGQGNRAQGIASTIGGGQNNWVDAQYSTIAGGQGNSGSTHTHQFIGGGQDNRATDPYATIGGGIENLSSHWATVGGGMRNFSINEFTFVGGGHDNTAQGHAAVIGGGISNQSLNWASTVGGGESNFAEGVHSVVVGGTQNLSVFDSAFIGGGGKNLVQGEIGTIVGGRNNAVTARLGTIAGGNDNRINGLGGFIGGGSNNGIGTGSYSVIPGGYMNSINAPLCFAAGTKAISNWECSFIWSSCCFDPITLDTVPFYAQVDKSFNARATGGFYFLTSCDSIMDPAAGVGTGVYVPAGGSMWMTGSSRELKENIEEVDGSDILSKISEMPIYSWNYKAQDGEVKHIGPMAEDFYETFEIGENSRTIGALDPAGVSLAASRELIKENESLKERITRLEKLVEQLVQDKK